MNTICKSCRGRGQTKDTKTIVQMGHDGPVTLQKGSGCPECLGTGIKGDRK